MAYRPGTEGKRIPVLDHGYIQFIEDWGADERIIEAARMSTAKGFQGWGDECSLCGVRRTNAIAGCLCLIGSRGEAKHSFPDSPGDEKLLAYLYTNKHATPFEFAGLVIEVKAPLMVFREWHRHRTQSYNEMSARYVPLPDENYLPTESRITEGLARAGKNKQARGAGDREPTSDEIKQWLLDLANAYEVSQAVYQRGIDIGIPKELARLPVPVARYSCMRASANLRNWMAFLTLRYAPNAQTEIRLYAEALHGILFECFPRTMALWDDESKR